MSLANIIFFFLIYLPLNISKKLIEYFGKIVLIIRMALYATLISLEYS